VDVIISQEAGDTSPSGTPSRILLPDDLNS
jgi:hypothetical protein